MTLDEQIQLMLAAQQFRVEPLYELCCATIAANFKARPFSEVAASVGLEHLQFSVEAEQQLAKDHPYLMDTATAKVQQIQTEVFKKAYNGNDNQKTIY